MSPTFRSLLAMLTGPLGVSLAYRLKFNSLSLEYLIKNGNKDLVTDFDTFLKKTFANSIY